jgi:hypothetical protein
MAARDFGPWTYTADDGRTFVRRADKAITGQLDGSDNPKVGGASAATLDPYEPMPTNYRPRGVYVSSADGFSGFVVVYNTDAALWTNLATTIGLKDAGGTVHTCQPTKRVGERLGRAIKRGQ